MTQPKQIIHPIRYIDLSLGSIESEEENFAAHLSRLLGGGVFVQAIGRARAGLYLLAKFAIRGRRRRIVMSPYTIPDVVNMVKFAGAEPIFVDHVKGSTSPDLDQLSKLVDDDDSVCGVIVTHYHLNQDMTAIHAVCAARDIMLIDDCAIALGEGEAVGHVAVAADASVFSFSGFKPLNYFWGGAVTTRSADIGRRVKEEVAGWARLHRWDYIDQARKTFKYDVATRNWIFNALTFPQLRRAILKGDENEILQMVRVESTELDRTIVSRPSRHAFREWNRKIESVERFLHHRRSIAGIYDRRLGEFLVGKEASAEIRSRSCWLNYPIKVEPGRRTEIYKSILSHGIDVGLSLYPNVHEMPGFTNIVGRSENVAKLVRSTIYLPTHPRISDEYATRLADVVASEIRAN